MPVSSDEQREPEGDAQVRPTEPGRLRAVIAISKGVNSFVNR